MNAVTKTEAIALETAAPLEVADPTKNLILVSLSQLLPRRSKRNVRTTPRQSIPELAASIARVGLLQNLIVILSADGEQYEVVAGDRRLTALKLLAKKKRIAADYEVPCLLVADASARTVSLAENVQREAMHPADQFVAFAALVGEGRPIEDIAADFGVSPLVVQRRLKLANVSPRLLADYRAGAATLEQLMALTITDDHTAQEAAYYGAPEWQRSASALRDRLTEREIGATHPLVRFVGLDAYTQAGGGIRRDLFAEGDAGTYLTDAALLEALVRGKLDGQAEDVRAEGWAWVEAVPHMSQADRQTFQSAPRRRREPTARETRRIASLQTRLDKLDAELEEAFDTEDEGRAEALEPRREQVGKELQAIEEGLLDYAPDVRAVAGAIVTLDREGVAVIHRGLLREAEAKALRTLEKLRQGFSAGDGANDEEGHDDAEAPTTASLSDRLAQRLAVCVASTVDVVTPCAMQQQPGAELAQAVGLDMAAWWKPTAEGYFRHIAKSAILDAVKQYAPAHVTRLSKLKKGDLASEAERLAEGTGWMPAVFQIDHHIEPEDATEAKDEAGALGDAVEVEEAHTLAA
ncbi:ParB N-terminal domain-containing protein [Burkholderia gladioli]|uniref:ParB N-terminal domain-containing protein n=1 Tax=Burkholderia gladioli TaxID=28095 RepID=UPI0015E663B5|nr:ParB N-terminal domain-containing protein [Burkholderia gladioli]MBA1364892.1 ParB/RepB/Spo0J family partition protein [Burkholderia gladioli]